MRQVPCAWVREERRVIVPATFTQQDALALLRELQTMKLEGFELVEGIDLEQGWKPSPDAIAQFVAKGVLDWNAKSILADVLKKELFVKGAITVEREEVLKGIVVDGQPALQVGVHSPMNCSITLENFYRKMGAEAPSWPAHQM